MIIPQTQNHYRELMTRSLICLLMLNTTPAFAGNTAQKPTSSKVTFQMGKTLLDVPGLPAYSGHAVVTYSCQMTNLRAGSGFEMGLVSRDQVDEVLSWYKSAFKESGWMVTEYPQRPHTILAMQTKDHSLVNLTVQPSAAPGTHARITIGFQHY